MSYAEADGETMDEFGPEIAEALARWGVGIALEERLAGGEVNERWRIDTPDRSSRVLRRYHPRRRHDAIEYEHAVLAFLAARGWPVAEPIPTSNGETLVETPAGRWSLFPYLTGDTPPNLPLFDQRRGAVLALLHQDLAEWEAPGQRATFARVTDLDTYVQPDGFESFEALLQWWAQFDAGRAEALAEAHERNQELLRQLGYQELPDTPVHYECSRDTVLFEGDEVTAVLDFDFTHLDARVSDLARSLVVDCGTDPVHLQHWVTGYAVHARPPLSTHEAALLPPLMVASEIWNAAVPLSAASRGGQEVIMESVRESIDERLPRLESAQDDLRRLLRGAAGYGS